MQAISVTYSGAGQGLIKDRLICGSALQVESWHSHGAHRGVFPCVFWRYGDLETYEKVLRDPTKGGGSAMGTMCLF